MASPVLISFDDLRAKGITLSRVQIWRKEKEGTFPTRVKMSAARIAWVESEIDTWIRDRIAARNIPAAA